MIFSFSLFDFFFLFFICLFQPKDAESSTIRSRIANLYTNGGKYADCTFRIDNEQIRCHKLILSTASPVFEAMFYGYFQCESIISIVDIAANTFKLMIEFIYTDHINDSHLYDASNDTITTTEMVNNSCASIETCIELFYCAEKYLLYNLRDKCLWMIHNKLNDKNILRVLDFALGSGIVPLQELCLKTLRVMVLTNVKQFRQLAQHMSYHMSKECLLYILECNRTIFEKDEIDISIMMMARHWCRNEVDDRRRQQQYDNDADDHDHTPDALDLVNELNLPSTIANVILCDDIPHPLLTNHHSSIAFEWNEIIGLNSLEWYSCYRNSYKSTGIVKIYASQIHTICIETNQTIALKMLIVNSRLSLNALLPLTNVRHNERRTARFSPVWPIVTKRTYDDEFNVKFVCTKSNEILYAEKFQQKNVEYNSKMFLTFRKPVVVAREQRIRIIFERPSIASGYFSEYPCKLYKSIEHLKDGLSINFNPETNENVKCILDGIEYAQIG